MTVSTNDTVGSTVRAIVAAHADHRGALLPILHAIQQELGHVPPEAVPVLAEELNLSRADVHGVVTFYHDFRDAPAGRTTVRICRAEACQAQGANQLVSTVQQETGLALGETSRTGAVTVEQVFCLGNCALGPSITVNGRLCGRVDAEQLRAILGEAMAS
ncbi:MAG TPA: formate dehydrogenase subunit gamma [Pseudonocardiaceae bacterium]|nr:formate dehydrogenase subunit gamma [Pseudonocardiaceae bacterium]